MNDELVQQRAEVKKHAKTLVQLGIEHFSTYSWTIYEQDSFVEKRRCRTLGQPADARTAKF